MKRFGLMIVIIVILSFFVDSTKVVVYNETDYINLRPVAYDPDNQTLSYFFQKPLSSEGTWQTKYGDAGEYNTSVTVSNGRLTSKTEINLIVQKKNEPPQIDILSPNNENVSIMESDSVFFNVDAKDLNHDSLEFRWYLDGREVSNYSKYTYTSDYYSAGIHKIMLIVNDGELAYNNKWEIMVKKVDRLLLLDEVQSIIEVNESDVISISIPDFSKYDLNYSFSEPLDAKGSWQTDYESEGKYNSEITISDGINFSATKKIKIIVKNVDRPATCNLKKEYWISEGEMILIGFNCVDPDGEKVRIDMDNLINDAEFRRNNFTWTPDYNVVSKTTFTDSIADKFHIMNRLVLFDYKISSGDIDLERQLAIRVFNTNRAPVIQSFPDISALEGEMIQINYSVYDPDNDTFSATFAGDLPMTSAVTKKDIGIHEIKLIVTDDFLETSAYAKVKINPLQDIFDIPDVGTAKVDEGKDLIIKLGDAKYKYILQKAPSDSYIVGNEFHWTPNPQSVVSNSTMAYAVNYLISNGKENITKSLQVIVNNIILSPVIISYSEIDNEVFSPEQEILFTIDAIDLGGENLVYSWEQNGKLIESGPRFNISFNEPGEKFVKVKVSNAKYSKEKEWKIIVKKPIPLKITYLT